MTEEEADPCLYASSHTRSPSNPIEFVRWAERMRKKGYIQCACPGCGRWMRWKVEEK